MADLQPAPKYAAYPRPNAGRYGSAERLESLGSGVRALYKLMPVVPVAALVLAIMQTQHAFVAALLYLYAFALFAGCMAYSAYCKVVKGMGVNKLFAVLPTIFYILTPVLYLVIGNAQRWGLIGYFVTAYALLIISLAIVDTELKRYGIACGASPGKRFRDAVAAAVRERRELEASPPSMSTEL